MIASIAGELTDGKLSDRRPFRAPHHSASMAAMVGGGVRARPGEVSLAHNGVLFLDELPEFSPQVLDSLRQPLEAGEMHGGARQPPRHLSLAHPAHRGDEPLPLRQWPASRAMSAGAARAAPRDYQARISGPLLDRIDIRIEVPALAAADLIRPGPSETSAEVAERVAAARALQSERYAGARPSKVRCNAQAGADLIETVAAPERAGMRLLEDAAQAMQLTARGYHRVLKLARTLADLDGAEAVGAHPHRRGARLPRAAGWSSPRRPEPLRRLPPAVVQA